MKLSIELTLLSDSTFGRGDGVAGIIDTEVEYDSRTGLPYMRGRTLRGLIVEECANVLYALNLQNNPNLDALNKAAETLFGRPGSREEDSGTLRVGAATFPEDLQAAIREEIKANTITAQEVLDLLTTVRRQTAVNEDTDAPLANSLRSQRALLRTSVLVAPLEANDDLTRWQTALLTASVGSLRRGGTGRNRGRGRLNAVLKDAHGQPLTQMDALFENADSEGAPRA